MSWSGAALKLSRRIRAQVRAQARENGVVKASGGRGREYSGRGQRMRKTVKFVWEPGSLVTILPERARAGDQDERTGIVIGPFGAGYFDVLTNDGEIIQAPGKRLRSAS